MTVSAVLATERDDKISCLFNPPELKFSKSNRWIPVTTTQGGSTTPMAFVGGESGKMTLELIFDSSIEGKTVDVYVNQLIDLMKVDEKLTGYVSAGCAGRPPWVQLHWGKFHTAEMAIVNLEASYTRFSSQGKALRANATLSVQQLKDNDLFGRQNPTSHTPFPSGSHQVVSGDRLESIAARQYHDPGTWRRIAEANRTEDPFVLPLGAFLRIPHLRDPGTTQPSPRGGVV
jgi:hypothetical protein